MWSLSFDIGSTSLKKEREEAGQLRCYYIIIKLAACPAPNPCNPLNMQGFVGFPFFFFFFFFGGVGLVMVRVITTFKKSMLEKKLREARKTTAAKTVESHNITLTTGKSGVKAGKTDKTNKQKKPRLLDEVPGTHLLAELLDGASSLDEVLKEAVLALQVARSE